MTNSDEMVIDSVLVELPYFRSLYKFLKAFGVYQLHVRI